MISIQDKIYATIGGLVAAFFIVYGMISLMEDIKVWYF